MTDNQKVLIKNMRADGYGYTAIAKAIGTSKSTVKYFCRTNNLAGTRAKSNARISVPLNWCLNCGNQLVQKPKTRKRKFCSDACRVTWWNSHPEKVNRRAVYEYTCALCQTPFTAYGNSHRKYCSHACYVKDRFGGGTDE